VNGTTAYPGRGDFNGTLGSGVTRVAGKFGSAIEFIGAPLAVIGFSPAFLIALTVVIVGQIALTRLVLGRHMIAIGERTGELEPMLQKVADAYDTQVDNLVRGLTALLEPILILVMGAVVTVVALSILLPMLNLSAIAH
jgi:uncharacterized membrane protein YoaK (UPF0700 family)